MPPTLEEHKQWTRNEWEGKTFYGYFPKVLDYLKDKEILFAVDAGGCTGEVSNIFIENIKSLEKIVIIEPILQNYEYILDNVKSENIDILVSKSALYYGFDYINIQESTSNVGGHYVSEESNIQIKTITLEELITDKNIDLIKMDIEGAEKNIIENSSAIKEISYIEIEFHNDLCNPKSWKSFVKEYLPNHQVVFTDEEFLDSGSCCSHCFLERIK